MFDHACASLWRPGHRGGIASAVCAMAQPWTTVAWALGPRHRTTLPPSRGGDCPPAPDPASTSAVTDKGPLRRVAGPLCLLVCLLIPWQREAHRDRNGGRCAGDVSCRVPVPASACGASRSITRVEGQGDCKLAHYSALISGRSMTSAGASGQRNPSFLATGQVANITARIPCISGEKTRLRHQRSSSIRTP